MEKFLDLYEFVDVAARNRKYPENTAQSLRAALKLYETELKEEELADINKFKENFGQITQGVFSKNTARFSTTSLTTYKSRVQKVLADFEKYSNPIKMNGWNPRVIIRSKKKTNQAIIDTKDNHVAAEKIPVLTENMHKIELALRPDVKILLILPRDLKKLEAEMIKSIVTSLISEDIDQNESKNSEA